MITTSNSVVLVVLLEVIGCKNIQGKIGKYINITDSVIIRPTLVTTALLSDGGAVRHRPDRTNQIFLEFTDTLDRPANLGWFYAAVFYCPRANH